ncbi:hypothetical protein LOTGIDRAFT_171431 [Lottia gigantea]|uniref:Peptidase A2 domain-containing protein n=1 Tax=Lottia gigantea TaxID=225164 RepID=V4B0E3_LOTGI|nr:hypothetical protein LOTGIDRAFT_171431 [Lottia gigantea]ESP03493.1 hypothetical protein LOTGIDRAFT_171431 [Lottia gigantea]
MDKTDSTSSEVSNKRGSGSRRTLSDVLFDSVQREQISQHESPEFTLSLSETKQTDTRPKETGDPLSHRLEFTPDPMDPVWNQREDAHHNVYGRQQQYRKPILAASKYDGTTPLMDYKAHFQTCIRINKWTKTRPSNIEEAVHIAVESESFRVSNESKRPKQKYSRSVTEPKPESDGAIDKSLADQIMTQITQLTEGMKSLQTKIDILEKQKKRTDIICENCKKKRHSSTNCWFKKDNTKKKSNDKAHTMRNKSNKKKRRINKFLRALCEAGLHMLAQIENPVVVADIGSHCIFGLDFLEKHGCKIDLKNREMELSEKTLSLQFVGGSSVKRKIAAKSIMIPAGHEMIVPGRIHESVKNDLNGQTVMIEKHPKEKVLSVPVRIMNVSTNPVTIFK